MNEITKDMTVASVLELDKSLSDVFVGFGMFCIFCHMGSEETIEEACQAHGIELDYLLEKLNSEYQKTLKKKAKKEKKTK